MHAGAGLARLSSMARVYFFASPENRLQEGGSGSVATPGERFITIPLGSCSTWVDSRSSWLRLHVTFQTDFSCLYST